jgi:hypothetical protein
MSERGLLPFGKAYACKLLAQDPTPQKDALARRLAAAPQGAYLAVDLLKVEHQGERIEGVGRCYDSNSKGVLWGHALVSRGCLKKALPADSVGLCAMQGNVTPPT